MNDFLPANEVVQYWAAICTTIGLPVAAFALLYAIRQLSLAQRAGSATALVSLHEGIRKCWADFINATEEKREFALGELFNCIEISCGALNDRIFFGESRKTLEGYLLYSLKMIEAHEPVRETMLNLLQDRNTFKNIRIFLTKHRKKFRELSVSQTA